MNKVMIITGASRGIGAATARLAAKRGYSVCVNYLRNRSAAQAVTEEITRSGGRAIAVAADVASEADVVRLFQAADQALGPLTAVAPSDDDRNDHNAQNAGQPVQPHLATPL